VADENVEGRPQLSDQLPKNAPGIRLASRAVIVNPESRRSAQNLSLFAAVLLVCNIAEINWRRLGLLNHSGGIQADRR
jgi:hypothetical protein